MIDGIKIKKIYETLPRERKRAFKELVFGKCRQSMNYFVSHAEGITFNKVEMIADFFGVSVDYLRESCMDKEIYRDKIREHVHTEDTKTKEIKAMADKIAAQQEIINAQKEALSAKNLLLEIKDSQIEELKQQVKGDE